MRMGSAMHRIEGFLHCWCRPRLVPIEPPSNLHELCHVLSMHNGRAWDKTLRKQGGCHQGASHGRGAIHQWLGVPSRPPRLDGYVLMYGASVKSVLLLPLDATLM
jgi:hypothetical protein